MFYIYIVYYCFQFSEKSGDAAAMPPPKGAAPRKKHKQKTGSDSG